LTSSAIMERKNVLLGITGSVAAVKGPEIAVRLAENGADVKILLTRGGANFWNMAKDYDPTSWAKFESLITPSSFTSYSSLRVDQSVVGNVMLHHAEDEWNEWNGMGSPVLHIALRDWADVALIAPLSAHTLAKIANGLCDDVLSCVLRAWDFGHGERKGKPLILAPAMNTAMWVHPLTSSQIEKIKGFWSSRIIDLYLDKRDSQATTGGVYVVDPQVKELACGEIGQGALADVSDIIDATRRSLKQWGDNDES